MRQHRVRISRSGIDRADDGVDHACALSGSASTATSRDMPTYVDHVRMRNDKENKVNMPSCQRGVKRTGSIDGCMPTYCLEKLAKQVLWLHRRGKMDGTAVGEPN